MERRLGGRTTNTPSVAGSASWRRLGMAFLAKPVASERVHTLITPHPSLTGYQQYPRNRPLQGHLADTPLPVHSFAGEEHHIWYLPGEASRKCPCRACFRDGS